MKKIIISLLTCIVAIIIGIIGNTTVAEQKSFERNVQALTDTEVIVLEPCIECPERLCVFKYKLNGEIVIDPVEDFIKL